MLGLLLIVVEFLRRWKAGRGTVAACLTGLLLVEGALAYQRNRVWGSPVALWEDSAAKSPRKMRPHFQLGFTYFSEGRCGAALQQYQAAARLVPPDYRLLVNTGLAFDCLGRWDDALAQFRQAAALQANAQVYSSIGRIYGKLGKRAEAFQALDAAARFDPRYEYSYVYRGDIYATANQWQDATTEYRRALTINPGNELARNGLVNVEQRLRGQR